MDNDLRVPGPAKSNPRWPNPSSQELSDGQDPIALVARANDSYD